MLDMEIAFGIPEETSRIAHAAFPKGNLYMRMRDELGVLFSDPEFADLFPQRGQPAEAPWRLATVTIFQFVEGLSDRQAADAVRARIDWKYAMNLDIDDPGFDSSVLCEFRTRLLTHNAEARLFEKMLMLLKERQLLKVRGRQRTDATHVVAAIRSLSRLECLGETLRCALNRLAEVDPQWMMAHADREWFDRYSTRIENYRLPDGKAKRDAYALVIGADGVRLLGALAEPATSDFLRDLTEVQLVRAVWRQQFYFEMDQLRLRTEDNMPPCSLRITSPYDPEARYSTKRETNWIGYKVHLTETCDEDTPHLITQVQTTPSTTHDGHALPDIQADLAKAERLPSEQLVDEGYTEASHLLSSQREYAIQLVGPVAGDRSRQGREKRGFDITSFEIDWESRRLRCPAGKVSQQLFEIRRAGMVRLAAKFSIQDCRECAHRTDCTHCQSSGRRFYLHVQEEHEALQAARARQQTTQFRERYAARAGIEGTLSEAVRAHGLRRSRYLGKAKTHLQHLVTATAMNFCRAFEWFIATPLAKTRRSHFARLKPTMQIA